MVTLNAGVARQFQQFLLVALANLQPKPASTMPIKLVFQSMLA
jgi:hypothetical protein